jgi:hypothetical protein
VAPQGPFGAFEWCRTCGDRPGDPKTDGLCEVCLPRDRPKQLRNAPARYRQSVRERLARVPQPGSTVLDPEQTRALADGLARLARAVDEHGEALHALDVLGTDAMHDKVLDAQGAVADAAFDVLAGWESSLPPEVLPDRT